jgi:superfamily I DNA and/or RNA helicase
MFDERPADAERMVMLTEQSRMAAPISDVVSEVFYDGKLSVADDADADPKWHESRKVTATGILSSRHVELVEVPYEGQWSRKYGGPIRFESAKLIGEIIGELVKCQDPTGLLVLSPFRAQRTLINSFLQGFRKAGVRASTVHRAQGSERHTVIFDPALGSSPFLTTPDAHRLINVALSRAQARLVVILSPQDRSNPLLEQIAIAINSAGRDLSAEPIANFVNRQGFPNNALGKVVAIKAVIGVVEEVVDSGQSFRLRDLRSGRIRTYKTRIVQDRFRSQS